MHLLIVFFISLYLSLYLFPGLMSIDDHHFCNVESDQLIERAINANGTVYLFRKVNDEWFKWDINNLNSSGTIAGDLKI